MRRTNKVLMAIFSALISLAVTSAHCSENDEENVAAVINALVETWNSGDMTGYLDLYIRDDSLRMLAKDNILHGWDATNQRFRELFPNKVEMGTFTVDGLDIRFPSEDIAIANGTFVHVFADRTNPGIFTEILQRQKDGSWIILLEHVSLGQPR